MSAILKVAGRPAWCATDSVWKTTLRGATVLMVTWDPSYLPGGHQASSQKSPEPTLLEVLDMMLSEDVLQR